MDRSVCAVEQGRIKCNRKQTFVTMTAKESQRNTSPLIRVTIMTLAAMTEVDNIQNIELLNFVLLESS